MVRKIAIRGKKSDEQNKLKTAKSRYTEDEMIDLMATHLCEVEQQDVGRIKQTNKKNFRGSCSGSAAVMLDLLSFASIKDKAVDKITRRLAATPKEKRYRAGTYIIFGDSHGKRCKHGMFALLRQMNKFLKVKKNLHIGHLLDDDDDFSHYWKDFPELIVVARPEEIRTINKKLADFDEKPFSVIGGAVHLGDLLVTNQETKTDYVNSFINAVDVSEEFNTSAIVNRHLHEFHSFCVHDDSLFIASPGCLCEPHVPKTIRQKDIFDGGKEKIVYSDSHAIYRRRKAMAKFWEQGLIVVNVDKAGKFTIVPCRIKKVDGKYTTAYFDKIINEDGVHDPDYKILATGDMHIDVHDNKVLHIQDQIAKDFKADEYVNIGDVHNGGAVNHHDLDHGVPVLKCLVGETAKVTYLMKKMSYWSSKNTLILGNHERFLKDFTAKNPQLTELLRFETITGLEGYNVIENKSVYNVGKATYLHGDMRQYGARGQKLEKFSRTFKRDTMIGHIHYPSIRMGTYSIGLTGKLDQGYNEPTASQWVHGLGLTCFWKDIPFMTTLAIVDYKLQINKKTYKSSKSTFWDCPGYQAVMQYNFDE